jgi:hypothetical protein
MPKTPTIDLSIQSTSPTVVAADDIEIFESAPPGHGTVLRDGSGIPSGTWPACRSAASSRRSRRRSAPRPGAARSPTWSAFTGDVNPLG